MLKSTPTDKERLHGSRLDDSIVSWLEALDRCSYYELLNLSPHDDPAAVQLAFHRFSNSFHPDRHRERDLDHRQSVITIFKRGTEAYGVLRDPRARAAYDSALERGVLRLKSQTGDAVQAPGARKHLQKSLEETCLTAGGRLHARQLERAFHERHLKEVEILYDKAVLAEGTNPAFEAAFTKLKIQF